MTMQAFNQYGREEVARLLSTCCGSGRWLNRLMENYPFASHAVIMAEAENAWYGACDEKDWLEAFTHHPRIGDMDSLKKKFATTAGWASGEQGAVAQASEETLKALAKGNEEYEKKFGFIFIVCATGKSADEMLQLLQERLPNSKEQEIKIAMDEQNKITQIRLQKLLA